MGNYRDFLAIDKHGCLFAKQRVAEKEFLKRGVKGSVSLHKVLDANGKLHLFWVCDLGDGVQFLPVFSNDIFVTSQRYAVMDEVGHNEFIYNSGVNYLSCVDEKGVTVWKLEKLLYQSIIASVCHAQGSEVGVIYPAVAYSYLTYRPVFSAWVNETANTKTIFPVDIRDIDLMESIDESSVYTVRLEQGNIMTSYDTIYRVEKDSRGQFFLTKHFMQIVKNGD